MKKRILMMGLILAYIISTPLLSFGARGSERVTRNGTRFCRWVLNVLGIKVIVRGSPKRGMLVANHQSYIDILSILSLFPCRFVTFTEMAHTIGVGLITKLSQTLFVHRSRPSLVRKDIAHLESELVKGIPFVFFPEGGSFDGSALQPFKSSLFESAIKTETPIQPVCLRYIEINGEPVTLKNRDQIFYHGEMNLVRQLIGILNLRSVTVEAVFSPIIEVSGKSRKEVAQLSREEIAQNFAAVSI